MNDFNKYKATFLKKGGTFVNYKYDIGMLHKDIMEDYSKKEGYNESTEKAIVDNGDIFFRNAGNGMFIVYMPSSLSTLQLYQLELNSNVIDKFNYLAVSKMNETFEFDSDIWASFSNIIQSYYDKKINNRL